MKKSKLAVVSTAMLLALAVGCTQTSTSSQPNTSSSSSSVQQSTSSVDTKQEIVNEAAKYLHEIKKDENPVTTADFKLPAKQYYDGVYYEVEWKVEITSGPANSVTIATSADKDGFLAVDVVYDPFASTAEVSYTLTATVKGEEGRTASVSFDKTIPVFKYTSHADYLAAKADTLVNVEGYIVARYPLFNGTTQVFIQTEPGKGYYAYKLPVEEDKFDTDMAIGNYIIISGTKSFYNDASQLANPSYKVSPKAPVTVEPLDVTSIFDAAKTVSDTTLLNLEGSLVTIKDVILTNYTESNGYMNFTKDGKNSYVRISSSGNCSDFDETAKATLTGNYPSKFGYKADVTGIATQYKGTFYLMPTTKDSIKVTGTAMEPTFAIDYAKQNLTVDAEIFSNLPNTVEGFDGSTITWASTAEGVVAQDGKVTPKTEPVTTTLTATIKIGDQTATKEFKDVVVKLPEVSSLSTVGAAIKAANGTTPNLYVVEGVIVAKDGSNRPYIMDEKGNVMVVFNNSNDSLKNAPIGSTVKLAGFGSLFNGLYQFGYSGSFTVLSVSETTSEVEYGTATPIDAAAYTKAVLTDKDQSMNGKYVKLTGVELRKSGDYFNLYYTPEGGSEVQLQLQANGMNDTLSTLDGKDVVVYGYSYGTNGRVARITAVKVEEATEEDDDDTPVVVPTTGVELDFSSLTAKGDKFDATKLTTAITTVLGDDASSLVSVTGDTIYNGNGDGGAHPQSTGFIKFGKSKTGGELVLTFDENTKFTKVTIVCHDWYTKSDQYPTTSRTLTVNGVTKTSPYNATGAGEELVFEITESNVITIKSSERAFVWSIVLE